MGKSIHEDHCLSRALDLRSRHGRHRIRVIKGTANSFVASDRDSSAVAPEIATNVPVPVRPPGRSAAEGGRAGAPPRTSAQDVTVGSYKGISGPFYYSDS